MKDQAEEQAGSLFTRLWQGGLYIPGWFSGNYPQGCSIQTLQTL